jgi:hypothetical protein
VWADFDARVEENEKEGPIPVRRNLFDVLRSSKLRPGDGATKKMVAFEYGSKERLLWELSTPTNFFLHARWKPRLEQFGFACENRPYRSELKDGGRHSALSRSWSFEKQDCIMIRVDSPDVLRRLLDQLGSSDGELDLASEAVERWIERLRTHFPDLARFDKPDPEFDAQEREYKLEVAQALRADLQQANSDQEIADAIHASLAKSNLLPWRAYWPLSPKGDADKDLLWPALATLARAALGPAENHPAELETFVDAWLEAVPNGSADPARQIAEFLYLHLAPDEGIYIRHSVRQDFWLEAVGSRFPEHASMADTYRDELRFMEAVRRAFEAKGLAPRDMIDVQAALWVAHNYKHGAERETAAPPLARATVEAAMDAYDAYRESGNHADIFESFGEPRDYWVRSTRERVDRVYPTKPIVGFARGRTRLNGGWGQKADAAASLHNSGFIIVDQADTPILPPDRYDHLIREADRIRLCAQNYYIEPAREHRAPEISIGAGPLAKDLGLLNSFPAICSALGGEKFQRLAGLSPPTHTKPNPSSSTIFTFQLMMNEGQTAMATEPTVKTTMATNLILYGPPGTGKTYATAWEAVRLCLGEAATAPLREDRTALMAEYRRLASDGRIEFVTFHQSFSYEEFVEGLRPTIESEASGEDEEGAATSGGFNLKPHAGIFKVISDRARLDTGNAPSKRLDRSRLIYKIALGQRGNQEERIREGLDNSLIHLGWGGDIDWSDSRFEDFQEIKKEWNEKKDPGASGKDPNIEMIYAFRSGLQVGDYVIVSDGRDGFRAFGKVTSDYKFDEAAEFHPHRRNVEWIWRDDDGAERASFYRNNFRRQSAYRLDPKLVDWDALEEIVLGPEAEKPVEGARPHVLVIDEINRANISKVFGELITLLEADKRLGCENEVKVRLPYSPGTFGVPSNLHVIGTMNTADRSIALLDTALRRRFTFRELMPDISALKDAMAAKQLDAENMGGINLCRLLTTINERIEYLFDREHQIGHAYFTGCRSRADVEEVMRHKVIPLLAEYFYEDWSKVAVVLGDAVDAKNSRFIEAKRLSPPAGFADDELSGEKLRWNVKKEFDFSEFAA